MDTNLIHLLIIILSSITFVLLGKILVKGRFDSNVTFMIVSFMFLMFTTAIFSIFRLLEFIAGFRVFDVIFLNYFSLFIKIQSSISGLIIGILVLRKMKERII